MPQAGDRTWLSEGEHDAVTGAEATEVPNAALLPMRMSSRGRQRFHRLARAHPHSPMPAIAAAMNPTAHANATVAALQGTKTPSSDLNAYRHLAFGSATHNSATYKEAAKGFAQNFAVNLRFLNFYDLLKSHEPEQPFCVYTYDDLVAQAMENLHELFYIREQIGMLSDASRTTNFRTFGDLVAINRNIFTFLESIITTRQMIKPTSSSATRRTSMPATLQRKRRFTGGCSRPASTILNAMTPSKTCSRSLRRLTKNVPSTDSTSAP